MKVCVLLMTMVLMVFFASATFAYPTFDGATGVVTLPTAQIAPQGTLNLAVNHQNWVGDAGVTLLRANWGMTKNLEISTAHTRWEMHSWMQGTRIWQGGLKYKLPTRFADVAIGG
ncbi:MAG: hypothetical protein GTO55_02900, partial [Armatimonadetes bacterium]|nr:hypothetical protein [Armatimonadota bacterium]NIM23224.1 hypothetical protein [Armatimonadota bacterium]NIM67092.1 hypothetical protein [Armatimonadota bacterium]NIM75619.1 hypothetical protein [Armatimonadota bacterium]NIN05281.1 hypothetical protein [Armatimonadota bacterium]